MFPIDYIACLKQSKVSLPDEVYCAMFNLGIFYADPFTLNNKTFHFTPVFQTLPFFYKALEKLGIKSKEAYENIMNNGINFEQLFGLKRLCYNGPLLFEDGLPYDIDRCKINYDYYMYKVQHSKY